MLPIPDNDDEQPIPGSLIGMLQESPLRLPEIVMGCATFSLFYNSDGYLTSDAPTRAVRLALRYGITAFDTSVYYGPSEIVLGNALQGVKDEFPRSSYQLMTKCGRIREDYFDYDPRSIRKNVTDSLERLQTSYLDTIYLHDIEFVCESMAPRQSGNHTGALTEEASLYGLASGDEAVVRGPGDQKILDAFVELQKMKDEGLVKNVGITGYPLATLLRLAILILHSPPYKPVDIILSYCHLTLQNSTYLAFIPHLRERAQVKELVNASPFSMGLLTSKRPPKHPAPQDLRDAVDRAGKISTLQLPDVAAGYAIRQSERYGLPLVAGWSNAKEVHTFMKAWRDIKTGADEERLKAEESTIAVIKDAGYLDWSWA